LTYPTTIVPLFGQEQNRLEIIVCPNNAAKLRRGKGKDLVDLYYDCRSTSLWLMLELFGNIIFGFDDADSVVF